MIDLLPFAPIYYIEFCDCKDHLVYCKIVKNKYTMYDTLKGLIKVGIIDDSNARAGF